MSTEGGTLYGQWKINAISFAEDSWTTIANVVKSGSYPYKVGDTKTITLDGFGDHTVRIANISACTNGETSETACGFVVEFADIITTHSMNSKNTCIGGYPATELYSYLNTTIYNSIPEEIRNVMIDTTVVSGHGSEESSNYTTTDKLYLLSAVETHNDSTYDSVASTTKQLDYYISMNTTTNNSSSANKKYNNSDTYWWLRTPASYFYGYYMYIATNKLWTCCTNGMFPYNSWGISPAFRIG